MAKRLITIGSIFAAIAVGTGAFGAHALEEILTKNGRVDTWETAVLYHFIHALGIIISGIIYQNKPSVAFKRSGSLFISGILFFSGSLYVLCLSGTNWLGAITPIGGVLFIAAWVMMGIGAWRVDA